MTVSDYSTVVCIQLREVHRQIKKLQAHIYYIKENLLAFAYALLLIGGESFFTKHPTFD